MSTPESRGESPGPWYWGVGRGKQVLTDANGKPMLSFSEWSIEPNDLTLIASAPEMAAMLRDLEWSDRGERGFSEDESIPDTRCPSCRELAYEGHSPDCPLNALLEKVGR